ncbi:SHOCT domain-containing protein [Candidatus Saccharibacteria bacterium]|nr:SHOCT domain-containing protein [Candidatus Saccharibacteria bacterium]
MDAFKDPNTLALRAFKKDTANKHEEFYNLIMKKIKDIKNPSVTSDNSTTSAADEIKKYKNLLDTGAITQGEFAAKKKELLNL